MKKIICTVIISTLGAGVGFAADSAFMDLGSAVAPAAFENSVVQPVAKAARSVGVGESVLMDGHEEIGAIRSAGVSADTLYSAVQKMFLAGKPSTRGELMALSLQTISAEVKNMAGQKNIIGRQVYACGSQDVYKPGYKRADIRGVQFPQAQYVFTKTQQYDDYSGDQVFSGDYKDTYTISYRTFGKYVIVETRKESGLDIYDPDLNYLDYTYYILK